MSPGKGASAAGPHKPDPIPPATPDTLEETETELLESQEREEQLTKEAGEAANAAEVLAEEHADLVLKHEELLSTSAGLQERVENLVAAEEIADREHTRVLGVADALQREVTEMRRSLGLKGDRQWKLFSIDEEDESRTYILKLATGRNLARYVSKDGKTIFMCDIEGKFNI